MSCFSRKWRDALPELYYNSTGVSSCEITASTIRLSIRPARPWETRSARMAGARKRDRSGRGSGRRGSGTGTILLSQATFLLAHIANNGPVPLSRSRPKRSAISFCHSDWPKGRPRCTLRRRCFQFLHVVALIDPLEPIRWHIDRPRRQQRPLFSRGRKLGRD